MYLLKWLSQRFGAVIYVPGNHEYYGGVVGDYYDNKLQGLISQADLQNVWLLQNSQIIFNQSLRLLGSTLWTGMAKDDPLFELRVARLEGKPSPYKDLNHIRITKDKQAFPRLRVADIRAMHQESRQKLLEGLSQPFSGKTWVITHHLPSERFVAEQWRSHWANPAYASKSDDLVALADTWAFGHTHHVMDEVDNLTGTRIITNAVGYTGSENPLFNPQKDFLNEHH